MRGKTFNIVPEKRKGKKVEKKYLSRRGGVEGPPSSGGKKGKKEKARNLEKSRVILAERKKPWALQLEGERYGAMLSSTSTVLL